MYRIWLDAILTKNPELVKMRIANTAIEPLNLAVGIGKVNIVKVLLKHGVNINKKVYGKTPLQEAIKSGNDAIIKVLREHCVM